jgi:hypothetical protein
LKHLGKAKLRACPICPSQSATSETEASSSRSVYSHSTQPSILPSPPILDFVMDDKTIPTYPPDLEGFIEEELVMDNDFFTTEHEKRRKDQNIPLVD